MADIEDFNKLEVRTGKIMDVKLFPEAHKPAYQLTIDFGPKTGIRQSSAQLTGNYRTGDLPGKMVLAVVNFPSRRIGSFLSDVLVLGVPDAQGETVLVVPDAEVLPGAKLC